MRLHEAACVLLVLASPALGESCDGSTAGCFFACGMPARATTVVDPQIHPATAGTIPGNRDSTNFSSTGTYGYGGSCISDLPRLNCSIENPWFLSVDVENGWVFTATNRGFEIWDARTNQANPPRHRIMAFLPFGLSQVYGTASSENKSPVTDLDAAPGDDTAVAISFNQGGGIVILDTTSKDNFRIEYQDHATSGTFKTGAEVYAATIAGRHYAFLASIGGDEGGLLAYDLDAATAGTTICQESSPATINCPGVWLGRMGASTSVNRVGGAGPYVVSSSTTEGLSVWRIDAAPALPSAPASSSAGVTYGVEMWERDGTYYVAAITPGLTLDLYRCSAGCAALVSLGSVPVDGSGLLTYSQWDGRNYLYVGGGASCTGEGGPYETLLDVTDPTAPVRLGGDAYWGWYYTLHPTGFNFISPARAKIGDGGFLCRTMKAVFDVHQIVAPIPPPTGLIFADGFESGNIGGWSS